MRSRRILGVLLVGMLSRPVEATIMTNTAIQDLNGKGYPNIENQTDARVTIK